MAIPAVGRFTQRAIAQHWKQAKLDVPGGVMSAEIQLTAHGKDKALQFFGKLSIKRDGAQIALYDMADNSGRVRNFSDADAAIRYVSGAALDVTGNYTVKASVGTLYDPPVPANMVTAATAEKNRLNVKRADQVAIRATITAALGLMVGWEAGTVAQQARKAEVTAQGVSVDADIAAIDARIADLNTIIGA